MLKNDFYQILESDPEEYDAPSTGKFTFSISLEENHQIYEGHFPGNPVVPGVCQVGMIRELVSGIVRKEVLLETADNIKFLSIIRPGINRKLRIELDLIQKEEGTRDVSAVISDGEKVYMRFKGKFKVV